MLARVKQKVSEIAQRALGIDGLRFQLDKLFWQLRESSESFARLKSFLMWSSSRVEPWLPAENFAQTEPEYDLAGFLYNFLPNRTAVNVDLRNHEYPKALAEIGYQVFCLLLTPEDGKRPGTDPRPHDPRRTIEHARIKSLDLSSTPASEDVGPSSAGREDVGPSLPARIDLMRIGGGYSEIDVLSRIAPVRPAVVQSEFANTEQTASEAKEPVSETIKAMRDWEYYWNIIMYRTESEDFVRMATNLGTTPKQSWGKIFFFQDYQLFLKANHWCKAALPRFTADALPASPEARRNDK